MRRWIIGLTMAAVVIVSVFGIKSVVSESDKNFFAKFVNLEDEKWSYAPKGLDYGMKVEEVIRAEEIIHYTWERENEILRTEKTVTNVCDEIDSLNFAKRYFFDKEGELASVRCELVTNYSDYEILRQLLYEQALEYMPAANRKTKIESIIEVGEKNERMLIEKLGYAKESDDEHFKSMKIPVTRVIWEDAVYDSEDSERILEYANSDVVFGIDIRYDGEMTVSLAVSRYQNRMSESEIQKEREKYPMHTVEDELKNQSLFCVSELYPLEWEVLNEETIAYIEVTDNYTKNFKKRYGEKYLYPLTVLADTEGILTQGEERHFEKGEIWEENGPVSYGGSMQMIFPVGEYYINQNVEVFTYSRRSLFYVTEDGYVISGFDENEYSGHFERYVISESSLCGLTVEDLMRKLKR